MTDIETIQPSEPTGIPEDVSREMPPVRKVVSPRGIIIVIVCALLISGAGLYRLKSRKPNVGEKTTTATLRDTELFFGSAQPVRSGSSVSIPIQIRTGANTVSAVALIIRYDPKLLTNVTIEPGRFFPNPTILAQSVNADIGKALLTIGTLSPRQGEGMIAVFRATIMAALSSAMTLAFDSATQVAALGENTNVVKKTTNLTLPISP